MITSSLFTKLLLTNLALLNFTSLPPSIKVLVMKL
jgi:hypothetical protein